MRRRPPHAARLEALPFDAHDGPYKGAERAHILELTRSLIRHIARPYVVLLMPRPAGLRAAMCPDQGDRAALRGRSGTAHGRPADSSGCFKSRVINLAGDWTIRMRPCPGAVRYVSWTIYQRRACGRALCGITAASTPVCSIYVPITPAPGILVYFAASKPRQGLEGLNPLELMLHHWAPRMRLGASSGAALWYFNDKIRIYSDFLSLPPLYKKMT